MDSFALVPSQPSQNTQSPVSASHCFNGKDSTAALTDTGKVGDEGELPGKIRSSTSFESSVSQDIALLQTSKRPRLGSKIFEKVRAFEEQRRSTDAPVCALSRGESSGSINAENKANKVCVHPTSDVALRRSVFKQRASSLEERPSYGQKVQNFQSRLSEELQRMKKLIRKPEIRKAFSTEHLTRTDGTVMGKSEPVPQKVFASLKEDLTKLPPKQLSQRTKPEPQKPGRISKTVSQISGSESQFMKDSESSPCVESSGKFVKVLVPKVPEQCPRRHSRKSLESRFSPSKEILSPETEQQLAKKDRPSSSPGPAFFKKREEKKSSSPPPKRTTPEQMEVCDQKKFKQTKEKKREGKSKQRQPLSPEEGEKPSSDKI